MTTTEGVLAEIAPKVHQFYIEFWVIHPCDQGHKVFIIAQFLLERYQRWDEDVAKASIGREC
jgi:hypothetical protein